MASRYLIDAVDSYDKYIKKKGVQEDVVDAYIEAVNTAYNNEHDHIYGKTISDQCKVYLNELIGKLTGGDFAQLEAYAQENKWQYDILNKYYNVLRWEAPHYLDSFMLYMERYRPRKERFYEPRRRVLHQVTKGLQSLEDGLLDELFIHLPARVGKTQNITFATVWSSARDTEKSNLFVTFKEGLGGAFIDGYKALITDPTYAFNEVFPDIVITDTDARNNKVDIGKAGSRRIKQYKSISGKGLESGLNGEYDANGLLIIDDILEGVQDVISEEVLKRKKTIFNNNVMSRKKENCKIIWNGTIWSTRDIFMTRREFLENAPEAQGIRYRVISIPALDPSTDESNFDYGFGVGFSTRHYQTKRAEFELANDMAGWMCAYQQEPIERVGRVFSEEQFRYYDVLPEEKPLKIIAHCDPALGGGDFTSFPVIYVYENGDMYLEDCVFDSGEPAVTRPQVVAMIKKHKMKNVHFESNQGGIAYKEKVQEMLKDTGYGSINITSDWAPSGTHKAQRIWDCADTIRQIYLKNPTKRDDTYRRFIANLMSFSMNMSKRAHDDAPDSLAGAVAFMENGSGVSRTTIISSPI